MKTADFLIQKIYNCNIETIFASSELKNTVFASYIEKNNLLDLVFLENELFASIAAEGYAKIRGLGAFLSCVEQKNTTIVITPFVQSGKESKKGIFEENFSIFKNYYDKIKSSCASINEFNASKKTFELLNLSIENGECIYFNIEDETCHKEVTQENICRPEVIITNKIKQEAQKISSLINKSKNPIIYLEKESFRFSINKKVQELSELLSIPICTSKEAKGAAEETSSYYLGVYDAQILNTKLRDLMEKSDLIITLNETFEDKKGAFRANINNKNILKLNDYMPTINLCELLERIKNTTKSKNFVNPIILREKQKKYSHFIQAIDLFNEIEKNLKENDVIIAQSGITTICSMYIKLQKNNIFHSINPDINQPLCFALGAYYADSSRRIIVIGSNLNYDERISGKNIKIISFNRQQNTNTRAIKTIEELKQSFKTLLENDATKIINVQINQNELAPLSELVREYKDSKAKMIRL